MQDQIDLLQIKIEKARESLPEDTKRAIDAVPWKNTLLTLRESHGYTFEQLGDLEIETELLLAGLITPVEYQRELEQRLDLPKARVDELINEMNRLVFSRIREELIKIIEHKKLEKTESVVSGERKTQQTEPLRPEIKEKMKATYGASGSHGHKAFEEAGIKILNGSEYGYEKIKIESPDLSLPELTAPEKSSPNQGAGGLLKQKFSGAFQIPTASTEHGELPKSYPKGEDPYRLKPE